MYFCTCIWLCKVPSHYGATGNAKGSIKAVRRIIMGYSMQLESETVYVNTEFFSPRILEHRLSYEDNSLSMELSDISLNDFHLIRGRQAANEDISFAIHFDTSFYVTHFVLGDTLNTSKQNPWASSLNTYRLYYQDRDQSESGYIGKNQQYDFFEMAFRKSFLDGLVEEDELLADKLFSRFGKEEYRSARASPIIPDMDSCLGAMDSKVFTGALQQLYLETKARELLLLQIQALMKTESAVSTLKSADIDCLHEAKHYIERNYRRPCSIIDLAKIVGINQTKLKRGFKELFGTTVFGYVRDLQMERAKQLLLEEGLYVSEVADQVGYNHPQHFTVAFKRKFGVLPSELKNS